MQPEQTRTTHNLFEEIPSLGIAGDMVMAPASQAPESNINFRMEFPPHSRATRNLRRNTFPVGERRPEIRQNLARFGITTDAFPKYVVNTRFNLRYLRHITGILSSTETFRNEKVRFKNLTRSGGESQVIFTKPLTDRDIGNWRDRAVQSMSASTSSTVYIRASYILGFQLLKGNGPGATLTQKSGNWCCVEANPNEEWTTPPEWVGNRNILRNVPPGVWTERFRCPTLEQDNAVQQVIRRMIKATR